MQLVRFLMKLTSEYVQVELKNGTVVAGTVVSVTPDMNTVLNDAKMTVKGEDPVTLDTITLRGSTIRYVILPETLPLDRMISDTNRRPRTHAPVPPPKRGRGGARGGGASRGSFRGGTTNTRGATRGRGGFRGGFRGGSRGGSYPRGGSRGGGRPRGGARGGPQGGPQGNTSVGDQY